MTCHQNPGPGYQYLYIVNLGVLGVIQSPWEPKFVDSLKKEINDTFFFFEIHNKEKLMIKIVERNSIILKQVIHNRFDINNVVTIFWVLFTGQNGTLDFSILFLYCSVQCTLVTHKESTWAF